MTQWTAGMRVTAERINDDHPGEWQDVTLSNWDQGALTYAPLRIQKVGNRARLDGHAQPGSTFSGNQTAFTVPSDLAPAYTQYRMAVRITSATPTVFLGVVINTTGTVTVYSTASIGATDRFNFSGIEWPLD
ncbi:hypothetical protein ACPCIZ_12930 [Streptomyces cellulosae]